MQGHTLGRMTAAPRMGAAVLPRWMGKVGARCECGLDIVGADPSEVVLSHGKHLEAVHRQVSHVHYPLEWTPGRTVCAACMPLADWPCDEWKESLP